LVATYAVVRIDVAFAAFYSRSSNVSGAISGQRINRIRRLLAYWANTPRRLAKTPVSAGNLGSL